jgi:hypothetical protein
VGSQTEKVMAVFDSRLAAEHSRWQRERAAWLDAYYWEADKYRVRQMSRFRRWLLAFFRMNDAAVCVMSEGKKDYHDYPDWPHGKPMHFHEEACKRCGKVFSI